MRTVSAARAGHAAELYDGYTAGWNIRVTSFDWEGKPRIVRNFLAYEADRETAIELVRKRVPISEGGAAEAVAEVSGNEFVGPGMRLGAVRRLGRKSGVTAMRRAQILRGRKRLA
jgi:hypothetical protein